VSLIEYAAVIGALAWVPPIFTTVRAWLTKPQIRVITQTIPEIGFTTLGPILNLRVALTVTHKDIVVTGIRLLLSHESGERTSFSWQGIVQRIGVMTNPQIGPMPFEKELNVLAMKVSLKDVEERFIRFQNLDFLKHKAGLEATSLRKMAYLRQTNTFVGEDFLRSQEMADLYSFTRQSFSWKPGAYRLKVAIESPDSFTVLDDEYAFLLTPLLIQELSDNLKYIEQYYANEVLPLRDGEELKKITWNWVYPEMQRTEG
jgi:hypothetical protein